MSHNSHPSLFLLIIPNSIIYQYQFRIQQVKQGPLSSLNQSRRSSRELPLVPVVPSDSVALLCSKGAIDQSFTSKNSSLQELCYGASPQHLFTLSL